MKTFVLLVLTILSSSMLKANTFDDVKNYLFKNGFKYRDAYSGTVDQFKSVNQLSVDLGLKNQIAKSEANIVVLNDLNHLNQAQAIEGCRQRILNQSNPNGYVVNKELFLKNDRSLQESFGFEFYGIAPSCENIKDCPPHRARLSRQYACSLNIVSSNTSILLHELYFTLDYAGIEQCEYHVQELLKIDPRSFLYEIYQSKDSVDYCAVNILLRRNKSK
ncbi:MAG: hypothetical protein CL674_03125 [Bdellovibrionaceae bacterium]|nr:hypothetical protein [Pseudobdellovibrionaceae bacterium]